MAEAESYFWARVNRSPDGCWEWQGGRTAAGYGIFSGTHGRRYAHRFSWELHHEAIPQGMLVCHQCDNPPCVRPDHLFLGSHADNAQDREAKGRRQPEPKTACPDGHPYHGENVYQRPDRKGRGCKECGREAARRWRQRNPGRS